MTDVAIWKDKTPMVPSMPSQWGMGFSSASSPLCKEGAIASSPITVVLLVRLRMATTNDATTTTLANTRQKWNWPCHYMASPTQCFIDPVYSTDRRANCAIPPTVAMPPLRRARCYNPVVLLCLARLYHRRCAEPATMLGHCCAELSWLQPPDCHCTMPVTSSARRSVPLPLRHDYVLPNRHRWAVPAVGLQHHSLGYRAAPLHAAKQGLPWSPLHARLPADARTYHGQPAWNDHQGMDLASNVRTQPPLIRSGCLPCPGARRREEQKGGRREREVGKEQGKRGMALSLPSLQLGGLPASWSSCNGIKDRQRRWGWVRRWGAAQVV